MLVKFYQDRFKMLQVKSSILYFFLLLLWIPLNLGPNAGYRKSEFSEILLEKSLEFILSNEGGIVALNLGFILLLAEVDFISKKQSRKRDKLVIHGPGRVKMILALSTKIVVLYI